MANLFTLNNRNTFSPLTGIDFPNKKISFLHGIQYKKIRPFYTALVFH
jgi:hypothetical protein